MQRIIDFILKYKEYFSFTTLTIISLILISSGNVNKIGGFRTIVIGTTGWLQDAFSWIPNPGALRSENKALRELNLSLSSEVTRMRQSLIENKTLREMVNLSKHSEHPVVSSEVVGKSTIEMRTYFTLDRGRNSGIEEGMAVRNDGGLVGVVIGANSGYSLVESIKNRDIKIAAKTQRSRIDGLLVWEGGEEFMLKNIPKSYDIKQGDVIVTSNYSDKYPAEIPIGQVIKASQEPGDLFMKVYVAPFVNFSSLEEVFVIKYLPDPERIQLIKEIDELIKSRKSTNPRKGR